MCRKLPKWVLPLVWILGFDSRLVAGEFRNLGFEDANTNLLSRAVDLGDGQVRGFGTPSVLLPGWDVYHGDAQETARIDFNPEVPPFIFAAVIERDYGNTGILANLAEGKFGYLGKPGVRPLALVQRGHVPSDAAVLSYRYYGVPHDILVNGTPLRSLTDSRYQLDGIRVAQFDISPFAGQDVELRLVNASAGGLSFLDSIAFAVPEPATLAFWSVAGLALLGRFRWKRCF